MIKMRGEIEAILKIGLKEDCEGNCHLCDYICYILWVPLKMFCFARPIEDAVEFLELVQKGLQLRVKHPTLVHAHSSRSHLVVTLTITTKAVLEDGFGKYLVLPHL